MRTQCCGVMISGQCNDCPYTSPIRPSNIGLPVDVAEYQATIYQLQKQVVMKFSEERVPQFSQGFESHELLETVTAEDCTFYVNRIDQLQKRVAKLVDALRTYCSVTKFIDLGGGDYETEFVGEKAIRAIAANQESADQYKREIEAKVLEEEATKAIRVKAPKNYTQAEKHSWDMACIDVYHELRRMAADKRKGK